MTTATCAVCGQKKELCESCIIDGVKQPRRCKDCLLNSMMTGDYEINDTYWLTQLIELGDAKSIRALKKRSGQ